MASKLAIYNGAMAHLGQRPMRAITEEHVARRALDASWDNAVAWCLDAAQWRFARRSQRLEEDPDATVEFGYTYAFAKPSDHVRLCGVWQHEDMTGPPLEHYREEGDYWLASVTPLYVTFVSNDAAFGGNMSKWPQRFVDLVQIELAQRVAISVTGEAKYRDDCIMLRDKRYLPEANSVDAMQDPARRQPTGSWVRSRLTRQPRDLRERPVS